MPTNVILEQPSDEIEYAAVTQWYRRPGDQVTAGEPLVEVEAEKAAYDIAAPVSGTLTEVVAENGDEVMVGGLLGVIGEHT